MDIDIRTTPGAVEDAFAALSSDGRLLSMADARRTESIAVSDVRLLGGDDVAVDFDVTFSNGDVGRLNVAWERYAGRPAALVAVWPMAAGR